MYKDLLNQLYHGKSLKADQLESFFAACADGKLDLVKQTAILSALNAKGVTGHELANSASIISAQMSESFSAPEAIDVCGTGGSGLPRINTSTVSAFILSALGVPVAKHGNRAASGRFGSFDLLEKLGIKTDLKSSDLEPIYAAHDLAFFYAPAFHPTMRHFAKVRKAMAVPTIFNLLGPLLSPVQTKRQIIGTGYKDQMMSIAEAAKKLRRDQVVVVCGTDGLDEVTLTGPTKIVELKEGKIRERMIRPSSFGVKACSFDQIKGGSAKLNTQIAMDILKGTCKTRHLDLVLINAALGLQLAGKARSLKKAYEMTKECVTSGKAYQQYLTYKRCSHAPSILLNIAAEKRKDVELRMKKLPLSRLKKKLKPSTRDFHRALKRQGLSLIAEIKKASPSEGLIHKSRFDVAQIAKTYEKAGARAISVLTDKRSFQGDLENLDKAAKATSLTPLLCKDFIIDEYQIFEARYHRADAVLLIAALLSAEQLQSFLDIARSLQMDAIVEVHDEEDLNRALQTDAEIIGINNRNLHTFKIDLKTTQRLSKKTKGRTLVAESGIATAADIKRLPKSIDAALIGTTLMKSSSPAQKIAALFGKPKPLLKVCGVQSVREAHACRKAGVDMIGLNFVPTSKRRISFQTAQRIIQDLRKHSPAVSVVGIFQDQDLHEVNTVAKNVQLDYVQLSGEEPLSYVKKVELPVIKGISVLSEKDVNRAEKYVPYVAHILFDGAAPGSGQSFRHGLAKGFQHPFILAGGINPENVRAFVQLIEPLGIDVASGVETNEKRDLKKIKQLAKSLH